MFMIILFINFGQVQKQQNMQHKGMSARQKLRRRLPLEKNYIKV